MKPCPFCGAKVQNTDGLIKHEPDCYIMVHFYSAPKTEQDRIAWDKRPEEDKLRDDLHSTDEDRAYWMSKCASLEVENNRYRAALEEIAHGPVGKDSLSPRMIKLLCDTAQAALE